MSAEKKEVKKWNDQPNRERLTRVLKLPRPTPAKTEPSKSFHLSTKAGMNDRAYWFVLWRTGSRANSWRASVRRVSRSCWKATGRQENRGWQTLCTDLIQHTKPCNQTTIVQAIRYNIVHQLRTTINDSIQHSQMAVCCRAPHYRSILQYRKHKASETMLHHFGWI